MEPDKGEIKLPDNKLESKQGGTPTMKQIISGVQQNGNPSMTSANGSEKVDFMGSISSGNGKSSVNTNVHHEKVDYSIGSICVNSNSKSNQGNESQVIGIPIIAKINPPAQFQPIPPTNSPSEAKVVSMDIESNLPNITRNVIDPRDSPPTAEIKIISEVKQSQVPVPKTADKIVIPIPNFKPSPMMPSQPVTTQGLVFAKGFSQTDITADLYTAKKNIAAGAGRNLLISATVAANKPSSSNQKLKPSPVITSNDTKKRPIVQAIANPTQMKKAKPNNVNQSKPVSLPVEKINSKKATNFTSVTNKKKQAASNVNQSKPVSLPVEKIKSTKATNSLSTTNKNKQVSSTVNQSKPVSLPVEKVQAAKAANSISTTNKNKQVYSSTYHISPSNTVGKTSINDLVKLDTIPEVPPLPKLNSREIIELEKLLQFKDRYNTDPDDEWKADWSGNLQFIERDIVINREKLVDKSQTKPVTKLFREWVAGSAKDGSMESFKGIRWLFSYIYHVNGTPPMARKIMAFSLYRMAKTSVERMDFIMKAIRRISYDPVVLQQDGWTTMKPSQPDSSAGGACLIGRGVIWHRFEAIIIAFVRDEEIGDLWKAMWLEDHETFDLEADELQEAIKKWEARETRRRAKLVTNNVLPTQGPSTTSVSSKKSSGITRNSVNSNFNIEGVEHGVVLAMSYDANARPSIFWPARVMHVSEHQTLASIGPPSRRSALKNQIPVIFLAPFWNTQTSRKIDANTTSDLFSSGPLFHYESVDISNATIKKYPYNGDNISSLSIDNLRNEFKFLGLPKGAFHRFLDSHRLAISLKVYAQEQLRINKINGRATDHTSAYAALTDSHPMSVKTAIFPPVVLSLPYAYILSSMPAPAEQASQLMSEDEVKEPVIRLSSIVEAMEHPLSTNNYVHPEITQSRADPSSLGNPQGLQTPSRSPKAVNIDTPDVSSVHSVKQDSSFKWSIDKFCSSFLLSKIRISTDNPISCNNNSNILNYLETSLKSLVTRLCHEISAVHSMEETISLDQRKQRMRSFADNCMITKALGEEFISSRYFTKKNENLEFIVEWRKACERIYKCSVSEFSVAGLGTGVSIVVTDSRCNQHLTSYGSFERPVRIPAAIKGAKAAGCGKTESFRLNTKIDDKYIDIAERKILPQAHKASYLKRIKTKIAALPTNVRGHPLTDDSDGEGGEDTMGSRGSYTAAVIGVAAGLQAVDMVVSGECVNVFCAVRPPGHHAGKELRAMNAISNGFCLLNGAACAAIYATSPISDGGRGLKRACVIDFDVHHGNGTQDVLCSTYDPRFLYVSLHAGGPHINGFDDDIFHHARRNSGNKQEGIFPGRCGDTSPNKSVLNIPLGQKVTAHLIGNALVSQVAPAVEAFSPDIIIVSAGFDGHKNDPLGLGGLSAEDFGSITDVACQMAAKTCSGRLISILEGGYGVPCCGPNRDLFLPDSLKKPAPNVLLSDKQQVANNQSGQSNEQVVAQKKESSGYLGDELPSTMDDDVPPVLAQKLERCVAEGFLDSVKEHVAALNRNNLKSHQKK